MPRLIELAGDSRLTTATAVSRHAFGEGVPAVVLTSAWDFPDALASAALAGAREAPLLLVDRILQPALAEELARLDPRELIIVGGIGAVPAAVQVQLADRGFPVWRIAGESRFDTAALLAAALAEVLGERTEAAVTSADGFADALAFGPVAASSGIPVLLAAGDAPDDDTRTALAGVSRTLVLGGPAAVSEAFAGALPRVRRLAGDDRYATSVRIAEFLLSRGGSLETVGVATAHDFPDALAAGPALARTGSPLLLVHGLDPAAAAPTYAFLEAHAAEISTVLIFGGEASITAAVRDRLRQAVANAAEPAA